jgi:hypothetical protein
MLAGMVAVVKNVSAPDLVVFCLKTYTLSNAMQCLWKL